MRHFISAIAVISLISTSVAFAGDTALAPGKPAGVHKAQGGFGTTEWLVLGGVVGLAVGIGIATSGGRSSPASNNLGVVTTATSST